MKNLRRSLLALAIGCASAFVGVGCSATEKTPDIVYERGCAGECNESYQNCRRDRGTACGYAEQQCLKTCASWLQYPDGRQVDVSK